MHSLSLGNVDAVAALHTYILWVSRGGETLHSVFKDTRHHHYVLPVCHLSLFSAQSCTLLPSFDANGGQILIVLTPIFSDEFEAQTTLSNITWQVRGQS